jgi:chaperonin GroEL
MSHTKLSFRDEARNKVLAGTTALADAVRVTLGPRSKSVLIEKKWGTPIVCNDGVTIVKELRMKDPEENLGAQVLKQAAIRTGDAVGDGTTTSTLLAQAIYAEGLRNIVAGASAIDLKRGIDHGTKTVIGALQTLSRPIANATEKEQVATVSAHNDPEIGRLVAEALEKVGQEGVVSVEEAKGTETSVEVVEGMQFDRGFLSAYFVTNTEKMEVVLEEPLILLHEKKISQLDPLLPLLEQIVKAGRPFLIVAEDIDGEALATLVINKLRGVFQCVAVKAPGFGDRRREMLQDVSVLVGGKLIAEELGIRLESVKLEDLGRAARVVVTRDDTTIIGGGGDSRGIEGRCTELRARIEETTSDYDREKLQERLAKLSGGVAVIHVGAASESEMKSRREAFDDAISATKAALAEGIVPGGGLALLRTIPALDRELETAQGDFRTGIRILQKALEAPARQIAENSGVDGGVVLERLRQTEGNVGFDAEAGLYTDLVTAGIIDPTKVVRTGLENAASVAATLLLTEATLIEVEDEGKEKEYEPAM